MLPVPAKVTGPVWFIRPLTKFFFGSSLTPSDSRCSEWRGKASPRFSRAGQDPPRAARFPVAPSECAQQLTDGIRFENGGHGGKSLKNFITGTLQIDGVIAPD